MIEGKAVAKFGTGDILVTPLTREDFGKGYVVLQNQEPHEIGEYSNRFENNTENTVLCFSNTESLDVFIERLTKLKSMMQGNTEGCFPSVDFDY